VAAREILGAGYVELGMALARQWNFPEKLRLAMTPQKEGTVSAAGSPWHQCA
jgi:HD-like signal output (HDOD) protein